jgi:hypothetical protein
MGHRHSPKESSSASAICGAHHGFAEAVAERFHNGEIAVSESEMQAARPAAQQTEFSGTVLDAQQTESRGILLAAQQTETPAESRAILSDAQQQKSQAAWAGVRIVLFLLLSTHMLAIRL